MDILFRDCLPITLVLLMLNSPFAAAPTDCKLGCAPAWTFPEPSTSVMSRMLGESVSFRCPAKGNPHPDVTWLKNGQGMQHERNKISMHKYNLVLHHLLSKDGGIYTCILENNHGQISWTYHLTVHDKFTQYQHDEGGTPRNLTVTEGQTAIFKCDVIEDPDVRMGTTVQWVKEPKSQKEKNGFNRNENRLLIKHEVNDGLNVLRLFGVNLADSGQYTCIIKSKLSTTEKSAWLKVIPVKEDKGPSVSGVMESGSRDATPASRGIVTYFKGVGISLAIMAGLVGLGLIIVCLTTIYRAVSRLDQRQERP